MKSRLFILCLIILAISFQSCGQKKVNDNERRLIEIRKCFPKEFTSHIPDLNKGYVLNLEIVFPAACYAENWSGINLVMKLTDEEISKYEVFCKDSSSALYRFNDKCLNLINYNAQDYSKSLLKLTMCDTLNLKQLPVSNFNYLLKALPYSSFYNEAVIYVLKAEKGSFLDKDNLSKNGVGLSSEWKHGYSKGIVLNRKQRIAFFWLDVW